MSMEKLKGKELMEKFHKGFKNKYQKKKDIQNLMDEVEFAYLDLETEKLDLERCKLRIRQLKRKAGFFDKRGNIFEKKEEDWSCKKKVCSVRSTHSTPEHDNYFEQLDYEDEI